MKIDHNKRKHDLSSAVKQLEDSLEKLESVFDTERRNIRQAIDNIKDELKEELRDEEDEIMKKVKRESKGNIGEDTAKLFKLLAFKNMKDETNKGTK